MIQTGLEGESIRLVKSAIEKTTRHGLVLELQIAIGATVFALQIAGAMAKPIAKKIETAIKEDLPITKDEHFRAMIREGRPIQEVVLRKEDVKEFKKMCRRVGIRNVSIPDKNKELFSYAIPQEQAPMISRWIEKRKMGLIDDLNPEISPKEKAFELNTSNRPSVSEKIRNIKANSSLGKNEKSMGDKLVESSNEILKATAKDNDMEMDI